MNKPLTFSEALHALADGKELELRVLHSWDSFIPNGHTYANIETIANQKRLRLKVTKDTAKI